jgi:hypothetical protein
LGYRYRVGSDYDHFPFVDGLHHEEQVPLVLSFVPGSLEHPEDDYFDSYQSGRSGKSDRGYFYGDWLLHH